MKRFRMLWLSLLVFLLATVLVTAATVKPRTVAHREKAKEGTSLTPASYSKDQLPGVPYIGAKPALKYKIAFSNGDMADSWRAAFYNDMIKCLKYLNSEFGVEYITANSGADSAKQIQDIRSLLAQKPDILLFSANEAAPLTTVATLCKQAGVPFITIDRAINATPGKGMYVADIEGDNFRDGIAMGIGVVAALTKKNGKPAGNIAEICGAVGASVSVYRSSGLRYVLKDYPNIKIVQVVDGGYDDAKAHQAAQDILTTHGKDLDCILCAFDTGCGQAMEVANVMGYKNLVYVTSNGNVSFLKNYLATGKCFSDVEYPPCYGVTALEYAIHYLNGYKIPSQILLSQRFFMTDTKEKADALNELINKSEAAGDTYASGAAGMYNIFTMKGDMWQKYYPKNYIQAGGDSYLKTRILKDPFSPFNVK